MGAPYIARAPKKVLVRIPRNEGYTTVPSGMATLRLIPSPLDKPQDTESNHTEPPRGASPLDRPQQFTTAVVPPAYTRNILTETEASSAVISEQSSPAGVSSPATIQQLGPRAAAAAAAVVNSEADRSRVVLQGQGARGHQAAAAAAVYQDERSSSPGHGGHLAAAAAVAAGATIAPRSPGLHYQGHFTAISGGRGCQQDLAAGAATSGRQYQPPPPFTDFIAGQVWRALMMASHQQQQQQQQVSGVVRGGGPVGGKRTRDVATAGTVATMEGDTDEEPTRKMSRVSQHPQHGGLQEPTSVFYSPSGPGTAASHTTFHTTMPPTPPSTPPASTQQQQQQTCSSTNPSVDGTVHLATVPGSSPKRLVAVAHHHHQQPLVPLSPPALHLPIMFPPVFPQSMTSSTKGGPAQQQFSLRRSNGSGPMAVSGSGGGGGLGLGAGPPHHHHLHQQASQLTVGLSPALVPASPLHHLHPLTGALLQPTHGPAAHVEPGAAVPYLTAAAAPTPMTAMMRMAERSGRQEHQSGPPGGHNTVQTLAPGLYRGPGVAPLPVYTGNNGKTNSSSSRATSVVGDPSSSSSSRGPGLAAAASPAHPRVGAAVAASSSTINSDISTTTFTSHFST